MSASATSASKTQRHGPRAFEIATDTLDEFFELLQAKLQEEAASDSLPASLARRAIYVTASQHRTYTGYGFPERVRRFVCATFCYGEDLVRYQKDTSCRLETWNSQDSLKQDATQRHVLGRLKTEIECVLDDLGLDAERVPLIPGRVRRCTWERAR